MAAAFSHQQPRQPLPWSPCKHGEGRRPVPWAARLVWACGGMVRGHLLPVGGEGAGALGAPPFSLYNQTGSMGALEESLIDNRMAIYPHSHGQKVTPKSLPAASLTVPAVQFRAMHSELTSLPNTHLVPGWVLLSGRTCCPRLHWGPHEMHCDTWPEA